MLVTDMKLLEKEVLSHVVNINVLIDLNQLSCLLLYL